MTRKATFPLLLTALWVVFLLPGVALAEETKKFQSAGFEWTVPDGWQFGELSTDATQAGYVARAISGTRDSFVMADVVHRQESDPNFLHEFLREVQQNLASNMNSTTVSSTGRASLGGVQGGLVHLEGKNQHDVPVLMRVYGIQASGHIHLMILIFVNSSQKTLAASADMARRGFKLLSGGGEEGPDEGLLKAGEGGGAPGGDGDDGESGNAPGRDGKSVEFPSHNLKWNIPADSPFEWIEITSNEGVKNGTLGRLRASIELEAEEGGESFNREKRPTENVAIVRLIVQPQGEGGSPQGLVKNPGNHKMFEESYFDHCDFGRMKIIDELEIGNHTGAALQMVGSKEGHAVYLRIYAVGLQGELFMWQVLLDGNGSVNDDYKQPIKELIAGIEFQDTTTWIRGPLAIPAVLDSGEERGAGLGEEKEIRSLGLKAKKPKAMAAIKYQPGGNTRLAWEARTEDKQNYIYFDVQSWSERSLQGQRSFPEDRIKEREGQWKQFAESPQTIKKGREPFFKSKWSKGRGLGYEFAGYRGEAPFMERGYIVEYKKYVYWVRIQLGGSEAETVFKSLLKELKKAVKFGG